MTEDELDRIKKSFVRSSDECPMEVACLLTVMKYYGGQQDARTLAEWCKVDGKYTLMGMKQAAIRAGMEAEICLQNMEQLSTRKFPAILFAINDFEVPGYVVCYGIHEGRFIIWEPGFGPMQYWENQMKTLWIRGITLTLFPTHEFMQKTDFQLKWWELYPWSRKWKRRLNRWYEYIWLNYPWFREMVTQLRRIIRKSKFPQNPKRSVRFSGKRTKRSVQKRKARNTQKAETKVL